jgi:hypothetical protein
MIRQMIRITPENVHSFPVGTTVVSRYGAYYPEIEGVVVGHQISPATKYFPASAALVVRQSQDSDIVKELVTQLYDIGTKIGPIGTYLIELGPEQVTNKKSPWAA